ncbi:MAG: 30S ribosomal protein S20 [Candidatus Margulisiibacteriota bacterium]|jgi:small subunit ribosomal protein S20
MAEAAKKKKNILRRGIKNVRKAKIRTERNLIEKKKLKLAIKTARNAILKKTAEMGNLVQTAVSVIDKAAERKLIYRTKAARMKSRLMLALNKAK